MLLSVESDDSVGNEISYSQFLRGIGDGFSLTNNFSNQLLM